MTNFYIENSVMSTEISIKRKACPRKEGSMVKEGSRYISLIG
jgi:hypothetical protein